MGGASGGAMLRDAMARYLEALRSHREEIDSLNVFPVPDGDTGTNLLMTQQAVHDALTDLDAGETDRVGEVISRAALMGARGNSGVILSQVLRGMCEALPGAAPEEGAALAAALGRAAEEAFRAVAEPVEGTMLTVLRDLADAGRRAADEGADGAGVARAALDAAQASLDRTPELLPELARAGVVDAGGRGIVLLLDALASALEGVPLSVEVGPLGPVGRTEQPAPAAAPPSSTYGNEVMYLLESEDASIAALRERLAEIGDSVVVVGGGGLFTVHVHTDDADRAVEEGRAIGRPRDVRVTSLDEQVAERCVAGEARAVRVAAGPAVPDRATALVAVAPGAGNSELFRSLGADVVDGGPGRLPSVAELVEALRRAPSRDVVLLPNHRNVQPAAEQAAAQVERRVEIVPTRSVPAGLAAATAFNPEASIEANLEEAEAAREGVVAVEVARAVRDADTPAGPVAAGDALGVVDGDVRATGRDAVAVLVQTLRPLVRDEHEVATVLVGEGVADEEAARAEAAIREAFPALEVEAHRGDQPHYPFLVGVE